MTERKPGMLTDPWRAAPKPKAPEKDPGSIFAKPELTRKEGAPPVSRVRDDTAAVPTATLRLPGYGAITVRYAEDSTEAAVILLEFLQRNLAGAEPTLLHHGVLVTNTALPANALFRIQRPDGWFLTVPGAHTREQGLLQLIQAFIQLRTLPDFKKKLESAGISAYRF